MANENRNFKIFEDFAMFMIGLAKQHIEAKEFPVKGKITPLIPQQ